MIDTAFFRTKQFVIAAVAAVFILGAAAAAYTVGGFSSGFAHHEGCRVAVEGAPLEASPGVLVDEGGRRRTVTYTFDAAGFDGGSLVACSPVGEILVEPSPDTSVHVEFRIRADNAAAAEATDVRVRFTRLGSGLGIAAWQETVGESTEAFGTRSASVTTLIRLPATGAYDVELTSEVGDLRVSQLLVGDLALHSDVGEVRALDVDVQGNVALTSDVGDVIADLRSVQSGRIDASSDVGRVEIRLPQRADIGYDVVAASDVGDVDVRLGETETYTRESEGPGAHVEARSRGYEGKPTKVRVTALSDVGSVQVLASAPPGSA